MNIINSRFIIFLICTFYIQSCCSNRTILELDNSHGITSGLNNISFSECGISFIFNGVEIKNSKPKIYYKFDSNFSLDNQTRSQIKRQINQAFGNLYYCGEVTETPINLYANTVTFINGDHNKFYPSTKQIVLKRSEPNKLLIIHELVHAVQHFANRINPNYCNESTNQHGTCFALNILNHNAPGLYMDIVNRFKMVKTLSENNTNGMAEGKYFLPKHNYYQTASQMCLSEYNAVASANEELLFFIDEYTFYKAKFSDEYDYIKALNVIDNNLTKAKYVNANLLKLGLLKKDGG